MNERWQELCAHYLPLAAGHSIWRYSRAVTPADAEQGWKLHLSATILTANRVLEKIGPFLRSRGTLFKGPCSLQELSKLNCGLYYGYAQIGKCFTVYPQTTEESVALAGRLHELTSEFTAPAVPFDSRFRAESCVYYRYGAFRHQEIQNADGTSTLALRTPEGLLVPDLRASPAAKPDWIEDPFPEQQPSSVAGLPDSPLGTTFLAVRALTQRGKGGVYQAIDLSTQPPRFCILKEGRRDGEPGWDGRDGRWKVRNEEQVLGALCAQDVEVPRVYASFEMGGNFYLVTEFIEGVNLQTLLNGRKRRLPIRRVIRYALQLSGLLSRIHSAGWVWRDCKPSNLIVAAGDVLRPIDFEGACRVDEPDDLNWGTPAYVLPESGGQSGELSSAAGDLYALGVVIYHLLSGKFPSTPHPLPLEKLRRDIPVEVCRIVVGLLNTNPQRRPCARSVIQRLTVCDSEINGRAASMRQLI